MHIDKPFLKYGPYRVDSFEKKLTPLSNLLVKIHRKNTEQSSVLEIEKMCLNSRCQPIWMAILEKVSHAENIFFATTLQQIVILTPNFI